MTGALELSRDQVLAYRRRVQALDERFPFGPDSLRHAAWAGLQDSVPRSALHSLHARVEGVPPEALDDPALVQVWGPRYAAYVVPAGAHAAFTLGRMPRNGRMPARAEDLAARAHAHLGGRRLPVDDVAGALGSGNGIRYATLTGTVLIRWSGARQPLMWSVPPPEMSAAEALQALAGRYLHVFGPSTPEVFARWAGVDAMAAVAAFDALGNELMTVLTPLGDRQILVEDLPVIRQPPMPTESARLLPSGDPYYLLWGPDREFLVPDAGHRAELWTTRVWPGAVLVGGEIVGTWRRSKALVALTSWRRLSVQGREAVEAEAASLPLPDVTAAPTVEWHESDA
ncbi:MAG TPA: crosslink repair DNA glycosylase YcaQ family protein [Candidatus Limnocylindria bacterium]|nr:crosslink repair DNA glycosylase YcaQ family protein [Candidatus Limnocylindria bacterium]